MEKNKKIRLIEDKFHFECTLLIPNHQYDKRGCELLKRDLSSDNVLLDMWWDPNTGFKHFVVGVPMTDNVGQHLEQPDPKSRTVADEAFSRYLSQELLPKLTIGRRRKWKKNLRELGLL